jgi:2'-5' RNA ligase
MRLFVGIELPGELKDVAGRAAAELRPQLSKAAPRTTLRWVDPSNLHITLWFLGEVGEPRMAELIGALSEPFRTSAFTLQIGGTGVFPRSGPPRALWYGVREGGEALVLLHKELGERLVPIGFTPEKRDYSAHLTIARFKDVHRPEVAAIRAIVDRSAGAVGTYQVAAATLFRSRLSPKGSQYEHVLRVPLR